VWKFRFTTISLKRTQSKGITNNWQNMIINFLNRQQQNMIQKCKKKPKGLTALYEIASIHTKIESHKPPLKINTVMIIPVPQSFACNQLCSRLAPQCSLASSGQNWYNINLNANQAPNKLIEWNRSIVTQQGRASQSSYLHALFHWWQSNKK
jgi:hypothetical protein